MNNIAILDNPYNEGVVISTRGVSVDSKAAKLNNTTKRPVLVHNWEEQKPEVELSQVGTMAVAPKDYSGLLNNVGITLVNNAVAVNSSGAKKLRVNKIVKSKAKNVYDTSSKVDVIPLPEVKVEPPVQNPVVEEKPSVEEKIPQIEIPISSSRSDIHGRHEKTGEIPVDEIRAALRNEIETGERPVMQSTRMDRNTAINNEVPAKEEEKKESKAGDIDLYTSLMHNGEQDDVSKQLQGAKKELSIEKEESRKLAEQYGEAVKELEKLKEEIESTKKIKEQKDKQELSATLNDLETIKKENLERTSDLSSIRAEISRLEAQKQAMEESLYEDYRSYGRAA